MARARYCSECGTSLADRKAGAKTCSVKCRKTRSDRIREARVRGADAPHLTPEQKTIQQVTRGERDDLVQQVIAEELRPVVREAITEEVMRGIADLVALTPQVVKAIAEDIGSEDPVIRQRAYSLVTKYTIGHQAIVRPPEEEEGKQLVVNFELPRPGAEVAAEESGIDLQVEEIRQCDMCERDKPVTDFVAGSSRCAECYEGQRERARTLLEAGKGAG